MVRAVFHSNDTCFPDKISTVHNVQQFILDKYLQVWTNLYEQVLTSRVPANTHSIRVMHHMGGAHTLATDEAGDTLRPPTLNVK